MTTSPFITAHQLADLLEGPEAARPAVLDASYLLGKPSFDGDYHSSSAIDGWMARHLPGSVYVDIQAQFSDPEGATHYTHPEPQAIADELARLGIGADTPVVIYDTTQTMFAARLWYLLDWIGVHARVLDGGLAAWAAGGHPVGSGPSPAPAAVPSWPATAAHEAWVTKEELASRSATDGRPLVCGLPATSFSGADPTRYSRRGHIPGSVNVSSRDLFSADGTVRGERELRDAYLTEGVTGTEEVLLYCGGGITATANALTLAELGITAVRIYDGSLEEWAADDTLPLEISA
ncbi:MAG: sulfurtransferase [Burkholderiaceae bacterium]|nr:sulfurtransferase [Microbacteriaceae bacterium]